MLDVLINNEFFIACNKAPGIASQPDKTGDESLLQLAEVRCKRPLHPVNRLDRPVSGIALFAKTKAIMTELTDQFRHRTVQKVYLAVVQNEPPKEEDNLIHYLLKNQAKNIVTAFAEERPDAELAELKYRLVGKSDRYFLLEIYPITGKHHQMPHKRRCQIRRPSQQSRPLDPPACLETDVRPPALRRSGRTGSSASQRRNLGRPPAQRITGSTDFSPSG